MLFAREGVGVDGYANGGDREAGREHLRGQSQPGGAALNRTAESLAKARSLLFVPGDRADRFDKAAASGADAVVVDLEDAVAPEAKRAAREATDRWLAGGGEAVVRINSIETSWYSDDVAMVSRHGCAVMVPKVGSAAQVGAVSTQLLPGTPMIALIETAAGIVAAPEICAVAGVVRAAFGSVDLGAELGIDPDDHKSLRYARSALVVACAAAGGAPPLDGVTTAVHDDGPIAADSARAVRLGFGGKLCIHPRHVAIINARFSPTAEELTWARRVLAATAEGGVCVVDGRMVDKPVIARAARLLAQANYRNPRSEPHESAASDLDRDGSSDNARP